MFGRGVLNLIIAIFKNVRFLQKSGILIKDFCKYFYGLFLSFFSVIMLDLIFLLCPRGFCAGVVRAIQTVERAIKIWGAPIYVKHEIVHNKHVVNSLKNQGAVFVEDLNLVPVGEKIIYSAH